VGQDQQQLQHAKGYSSDPRYPSRLLSNLNSLRNRGGASSLCDVEIAVGPATAASAATVAAAAAADQNVVSSPDVEGNCTRGAVLYAHRTILAAASPYFNAMFTSDVIEARRHQVVIQGLSRSTLNALLDFIYTGGIRVTQDNVQDLLIGSDMIQVQEVVDLCTRFLLDQLDPTNAIGMYRFAVGHNFMRLRESTMDFVYKNFPAVSQEEEFKELPKDILCQILDSELLCIDSEYQVFKAAMVWIQSDVSSRRRHVFDVLKHVRLSLVPSKRLESYMKDPSSIPDMSLKVALNSFKTDMETLKGSLVTLQAQPRKCARKRIYVIGGSQRELCSAWARSECTYDSVEMFDVFSKSWVRVSSMRNGRLLPGISVLNGKIYVCGGEQDCEILSNCEVYDPAEDTWSELASMNIPKCEFGMCSLNGYIYAFGGWVGEDIGGAIERYDPSNDAWSVVAKMEEPRFSMGIVVYEGKIYLMGGCTHSRRHMQELVSYNPVTDEWKSHANMIDARSQMGCLVLGDHLYVIGGTNRHNEVLRSVERFSFKHGQWEVMPSMLEPRASPSVAAVDNRIYVFGGDQISEVNFYRARNTISAVEVFDPLTNEWSRSLSLPDSRSEAGAVVI